ncbi:MAG TPA: hypothetical protein VMZ11_07135 [Mycobacteriales bacterium]|nr:hypothetical protein [Mycobacteriales bacterium]
MSHLPRRLLVGVSSTALVLGAVGLVPLLTPAAAGACPSWTDAAGDSGMITPLGTDPTGVTADDDLDIVSTTVAVDPSGALQVVVGVKALSDTGPALEPGDEFSVRFTAGGTAVTATLARDTGFTGDAKATLAGAASAAGAVAYDLKANTVTGTFTADQVKTALGKAIAGVPLTAFSTLSYGYTLTPLGPALGFPNADESTAPAALAYTDAGGCAAGTPGPTGTATATATATPTATASATPSATASPTASPKPSPTSTVPASHGGLFDQPRKGCVSYKDATGDADPTGTGIDAEPALDITQVNLKSPANALQVYVGLADPSAALFPVWDGPSYTAHFSVGTKAVTLTAPGTGPATATVGSAASKDIKATAKLDTKAKNIVFTVPLAGLSKAVGKVVKKGTVLTTLSAETAADSLLGPQTADTAAGTKPAEKTYTVGDNRCWIIPPGSFVLDADRTGQYGDRTRVFATLKDEDASPVPGVKVTGLLTGGRPVTAKTDSDGIADLILPLTMPAGAKTLTVTFSGDGEVGRTRATKAFNVVPEKTLLKVTALRGGASAKVLDNDRPGHAVVGRYVRFTVGGKSRLVKTNSKGLATISGLRKGTLVKVTFLPVRNLYLGTPTYSTRAR